MPQTHLSHSHPPGQRIKPIKKERKQQLLTSLCKGEKKNQTSSSIPTKLEVIFLGTMKVYSMLILCRLKEQDNFSEKWEV